MANIMRSIRILAKSVTSQVEQIARTKSGENMTPMTTTAHVLAGSKSPSKSSTETQRTRNSVRFGANNAARIAVARTQVPARRNRTINDRTIRATMDRISNKVDVLPLLPSMKQRLYAGSSEGGPKSTSDNDDPFAWLRICRTLGMDKMAKPTDAVVIYVNTSHVTNMTTKEGADDLTHFLVERGACKTGIKRELAFDKNGVLEGGVYVVYGDDPNDRKGPLVANKETGKLEGTSKSMNQPGSVDFSKVKFSKDTEISKFLLASPSGLIDMPTHNLCVAGDGLYGTNDQLGLDGEMVNLIDHQRTTLTDLFSKQGFAGKELREHVDAELKIRQHIMDFDEVFARSLTVAQSREIVEVMFPDHPENPEHPEIQIRKDSLKDIDARGTQNKQYMLGQVVGGSPDAYIGNRTRRGMQKYFPSDYDAVIEDIKTTRTSELPQKRIGKIPDFVIVPQTAALPLAIDKRLKANNDQVDMNEIDKTLSKADGFPLLAATDKETKANLLGYFTQPAMLAENFGKEVGDYVKEKMGADGKNISLDALKIAAAIHLEGIDRARKLVFPHIETEAIPNTKTAFNDLIESHLKMTDDSGYVIEVKDGWDLAKIPENDSLAAMMGIHPGEDPANAMFATDINSMRT